MSIKRCKGNGKAKGFGCGVELPYTERNGLKSYKAKYGLGLECRCYNNWLISDNPNAKEQLNKLIIDSKKKVEDNKKKEWNTEKSKLKKKLETKSDLLGKLQKEINTIVRLIDKDHKCISSGRALGNNFDAGHLYTVGGNPQLRFHLFNIFAQSVHDNQYKGGNELEYFLRLEIVFNKEFQQFVLSLKQIKDLHLERHEIRDKISIARGLVKWLKLQDRTYTTEERLSVRSDMNKALGIYPKEFLEFILK